MSVLRVSRVWIVLVAASMVLAACGSSSESSSGSAARDDATTTTSSGNMHGTSFAQETLRISAIPDQDPAKLTRLYGLMATYLHDHLDVPVEFVPVTDYAASVSQFQLGDLDLVWFGGLTGVQARLQTPGSVLVAQRDIDETFRSVFIAGAGADVPDISNVDGLDAIAGKTVTFGSESSTSGRLMPQYFLDQAGVAVDDLAAPPGFSGSHDATIKAVEAGSFEVGALNAAVWDAAVEAGTVDTTKVVEVFRTPTYYDYHWLARPGLDKKFGKGFTAQLTKCILALDADKARDKEILELFTATSFVPTKASNYDQIEAIARKLGLITG